MTHDDAREQMALLLQDIAVAEERLRAAESSPIDLERERTHVINRKTFYGALQAALGQPERVMSV